MLTTQIGKIGESSFAEMELRSQKCAIAHRGSRQINPTFEIVKIYCFKKTDESSSELNSMGASQQLHTKCRCATRERQLCQLSFPD